MPPRKKQKIASTAGPVSSPPVSLPPASLLARAASQYAYALSLRSKEHLRSPTALIHLDAWLTGTLAPKIASAQPLTKADLTDLMKWKLARGKSRPTLLALIASNPAPLVASATAAALHTMRDAAHDREAALRALPDACTLRGVGPATASALLTLHPPHVLPFMSDEAAAFFAPAQVYRRVLREVRARAGGEGGGGGEAERWDSMRLERALFALAVLRKRGEERVLQESADASVAETEAPTRASASSGSKRRRDSDS
ncbi:hypothetical protein B0H15DRAFT_944927 [Mycena belliarum]|uniref:Uncharacterized protein n=1 Tax=Mycena belliarum TaxID=1033014 RepID=A0AAD6XU03_9AGAR|nr:hypothetical protein B0H15DRAFT_944927 [Mycena belliae]